jgi:subtilisin family serine protease
MTRRSSLRHWLALAAAAFVSLPALGWSAPKYIPGQIIVKYKPGTTTSARVSLRAQLGGPQLRDLRIINAELVKITGMSVEKACDLAKRNANVEYAEPDYELNIAVIPNDTRFNELYAMRNTGQTGGTPGADIKATNAWDVFTGDPNLKVGVIDTGVDYTHPDLAANIWTNPGETPGNGIDDDNNGYIDDIHGYDFVNNDGDPMDDNGHGSHCSGTIAGVGNNGLGVTGVNWQCKIVGIKFLNSGGSGSTAGAIASVQYAVAVGVKLTSNSWGGGGFDQSLLDAINAANAANQLFIAAAGNNGSNNDVTAFYPANYNSPAIISVAATDHNDQLASFSNFGVTMVDLGAPGVDILSCQPGGGYQLLSGTSMATPHVSGVAALIYGRFPGITNTVVKNRILSFATPIPALTGKCVTGARLNALGALSDPDNINPDAVSDLATTNPGSTTMGLTWTATGDDGTTGRAARVELRYSTAPIDDNNFGSGTLAPTPNPDPAGTPQSTEVSGLAYSTLYYFAMRAFDEWDNGSGVSNVATNTTLGAPAITTSSLSQVDLLTGQQAQQTLNIANTGAGTLDYTLPAPTLLFKAAFTPVVARAFPMLDLGKNQRDPRVGDPVVSGVGGPDAAGYRWIDSDEPGGPSFSWVDITGVGTAIPFTGDDQNLGPYPIGFSFPFYGNTFSTVRVCSNGWLSFTSTLTQYTNQSLPAGGATNPENLVAPFWDDLNFSSGGTAYYYNDGSRFIIAWVNAPHYTGDGSAPGPYTFEAILYPTGEIRYQYLSVAAPVNSNTIGIQNATKTVGLQTAFNTNYVHDNLAVRIKTINQWLSVSPTSGRIVAGDNDDITVNYDASGLEGGIYNAIVKVLSNAPTTPTDVPATLHVVGAPNITATASADFGLTYIGFPTNRTITVANTGTDMLNITAITSGDPTVSAAPSNFTLAPSGSQNVTLTYTPVAPGALSSSLTIQSNDPDEPSRLVTVTGSSNDPPDIAASSASMGARMQTNSSENATLRISNTAIGTAAQLDFTVTASVSKASRAAMMPVIPSIDLGKDEIDHRAGMPAIEGSGGPDAFGYRWKDSDAAGGPTFGWVDISGVGTAINFNLGTRDDGNASNIPLGFSFPFYGSNFTTVNISTNGWLSFTSTSTSYLNQPLPTGTSYPENLVAPFWDDLDLRTSGQAYYYNDGSRFIVAWVNCPHYSTTGTGPYTFEAILYPSGKVVYQYLSMGPTQDSATIGIQNAPRTIALQMVYNANYVHNNLAIQINRTPEWLSVAPGSGSLAGLFGQDLTVTFNSTDLAPGTYLGNLHVASNDPNEAAFDIPVTLQVITPTDVEQSLPTAFALTMASGNPAHGSAQFNVALPKRENVSMRVYNVRGEVVRELAHDVREAGYHVIGWNGRNQSGQAVASGIYFVRMQAGTFERTMRVTMMK